jgi:hypothetical protein
MALDTLHHLVCRGQNCGFRVHDRYFEQKQRFQAGTCPNCNSPIDVVEPFSDIEAVGWELVSDPADRSYGSVRRISQ